MPSSRLQFLTFFTGLLVVAALVLVDVRHWHRGDAAAPPARTSRVTTSVAEQPRSILVRTGHTPPRAPAASGKLATLVLSARRGDCWVSVRAGSSKGADLY